MKTRVAVLIPSIRGWAPDFGLSLARLVDYCARVPALGGKPIELDVLNMRGGVLAHQRETLAEQIVSGRHDFGLWLDDDMAFPAETLHVLLKRERKIIGATCVLRTLPPKPNAVRLNGEPAPWRRDLPLEQVQSIGFGAMLTARSVFETMRRPWFDTGWARDRFVGEDVWFCGCAREAGFKVWADHELGLRIGHVGESVFTPAGGACVGGLVDWGQRHLGVGERKR